MSRVSGTALITFTPGSFPLQPQRDLRPGSSSTQHMGLRVLLKGLALVLMGEGQMLLLHLSRANCISTGN